MQCAGPLRVMRMEVGKAVRVNTFAAFCPPSDEDCNSFVLLLFLNCANNSIVHENPS